MLPVSNLVSYKRCRGVTRCISLVGGKRIRKLRKTMREGKKRIMVGESVENTVN